MNAEGRPTIVTLLPHASISVDPIHASVNMDTLEMDFIAEP